MKDFLYKSKSIIAFAFIILFTLNFNSSVYSQANSVRLDGTLFFNSITAAYNSLGGTISAPHVIELLVSYNDSAETFPINLTQKTGSSALNTITIRPASGNTAGEITSNGAFACISLNGADYIIIDGRAGGTGSSINLTIKNSSTDVDAGIIDVKNGASNNTVKYANCYAPGASGTLSGGRNINISQSTSVSGGNNNNTIDHCIINGGRRGVQTFGTVGGSFSNNNTIITNNIIKNQTTIGVFHGSESVGNKIFSNEIYMDTVVITAIQYYGILCQGVGNIEILSNRIYNLHSSASSYNIFGIRTNTTALTVPGPSTCKINIINNFVSIIENNTFALSVTGIDITPGSTAFTTNIYNNSLRNAGTAGSLLTSSICLNVSQPGAGSSLRILNNLLSAERVTGNDSSINTAARYSWDGLNGDFDADYNSYGSPETTLCVTGIIFNGILYELESGIHCADDAVYSEPDWHRTVCPYGIESNSNFRSSPFRSGNDLHLDSARVGGNMNGMPLDSVTTDIDGDPRDPDYPYRGADEGPKLKVLTVRAVFEGFNLTSGINVGPYAIRNSVSPYNIISTCSGELDNQSNVRLCFGDSISIGPDFYVVVKQRNHLETWSSSAIHFAANGTNTYIFDAALLAAYGNNMAGTSPPFRIYGGDVDQNGVIDGLDQGFIDNDVFNFIAGCDLNTDITDNGFVDAIDIAITDNNAANFVSLSRP